MHKLQTTSVGKSCSGNKCDVCHTCKISFIFTPSSEDAFFLLNKLFEIPTEHCAKSLNQQLLLPAVVSTEERLATGLQLQLCSSCEVEIEKAKQIYRELVVAVGQFRNIQKKLAISIKTGLRKDNCRDETESGNMEGDHCWSLFGTDIANSNTNFFHVEECAPFLVEDICVKLELITAATSSTAQSTRLVATNEKQNIETETAFSTCHESVSETEGRNNDENVEMGAAFSEPVQDDINSPVTVKEEYDSWFDDVCIDDEEEGMSITAEKHVENHASPPEESDTVDSMTDSDDPTYPNNSKKSSFQCRRCDLRCSSKRGLSIHMSRKHGVYGAQREKNQLSKNRKNAVLVTSEKEERIHDPCPPKGGKFKCLEEGCGKSFNRPYMLHIHLSRHAKQPMFNCQLCEEVFYTKLDVRKHIRKVHPEASIPKEPTNVVNFTLKIESYECNVCSKVFKSRAAISNHKKNIHGIVEPLKPRVCPEQGCGHVFKRSQSLTQLREHLSRCHAWEPTFKCSKCDKTFITWKQKWRHEQEVHADGLTTRPYICDLCGKGFTCSEYLNAHRSISHYNKKKQNDKTDVSQRCICELCGLSLCMNSLKSHMHLQHGAVTPVTCDVCKKTYKTRSALNTHKLLVHHKDKLKAACHLCERKFRDRKYLALHIFHKHRNQSEECANESVKNEIFQCPITGCRITFYKDKSRLDKHMLKIHGEDGKKPGAFKCRYCGQEFFHGYKLRHHEMTHENKETRPYICDICQKGFPTAYHLQFHKTHTHKLTGVKLEHGAKRKNSSSEGS